MRYIQYKPSDQQTPKGYYNIERTLKAVINKVGQLRVCGTCSVTSGINKITLINGIEISTMSQLAKWTKEADSILTF
jgi:uncharacterized protein involved in oxidation of intracellular sulfur